MQHARSQPAWGQPGSFLLPGVLRWTMDERVVPFNLYALMPSISPTIAFRDARFPPSQAPLAAVGARIVDFMYINGLSRIPLMPLPDPRELGGSSIGDIIGRPELLARIVRAIPELDRLISKTPEDGIVSALENLTLNDLLRSAKWDAPSFLTAATSLDGAFDPSSTEGRDAEPDGFDPDTAVSDYAGHRGREPEVPSSDPDVERAPAASDSGAWSQKWLESSTAPKMREGPRTPLAPRPLLNDVERATLGALSAEEWSELLAEQPQRIQNVLLRTFGGEDGLRNFLATADATDLTSVPRLGRLGRTQLALFIETLRDPVRVNAVSGRKSSSVKVSSSAPEFESDDAEPVSIPEWADRITGSDPRFGDLLGEVGELSSILPKLSPRAGNLLVDQVRQRLQLLDSPTIENEALAIVAAAVGQNSDHPRATAMSTRYGIHGGEPATMAEIATALGVSRARVGQISQRMTARLPTQTVWAPRADQMIQTVESVVPCSLADLNEALMGAGLTNQSWTVAALIAVASLTGRTVDLEDVDGFVTVSEQVQLVRRVLVVAKRISDRNGAAAISQVHAECSGDDFVDESFVRGVLADHPVVHWLSRNWFWTTHGSTRNRLVNTSQRILAVHQPQTLESMLDGVKRNYSWRNSTGRSSQSAELQVPAVDVLRAFYADHPTFDLDHDEAIRSAQPVDIETLGPEKLTLVGVLRAQERPAMSRNDLIEACSAEGMSTATTSIFLTYAECIENFGPNVWGLRGTDVPVSYVEDLQRSARSRNRAMDRERHEGTTEGGRPWFAQRLTPGMLYSGVLASKWTESLKEDAALTIFDGTDGKATGSLRRSGLFMYGLSKLIRKNRSAVGDFVRVTLYRDDGFAVAEVGGPELAECPGDDWA